MFRWGSPLILPLVKMSIEEASTLLEGLVKEDTNCGTIVLHRPPTKYFKTASRQAWRVSDKSMSWGKSDSERSFLSMTSVYPGFWRGHSRVAVRFARLSSLLTLCPTRCFASDVTAPAIITSDDACFSTALPLTSPHLTRDLAPLIFI